MPTIYYRPSTITPLLYKYMKRVLNSLLLGYIEAFRFGFRRGLPTGELLGYATHRKRREMR